MHYTGNLNRGRFETWTHRPDMDFLQVKQVHGVDIVSPTMLPCEADGIAVSWEELKRPLAIKTADCMPIVIEGVKGVVCLHAGWRGLALGILSQTEIVQIEPQRAFIGPCIHVCCFEVSPDFKNNFKDSPHFSACEGQHYFDLTLEARDQLRKTVPGLLVEIVPTCTCCNGDYHSHRRDKTTERNWNIYIKG
jgi:copper oxidase (laccase) domain-containing protein